RHRRTSPRDAFGEEDGFFLLPTLRRSSRLRISSQPPSTKRIIYSEVLVFTLNIRRQPTAPSQGTHKRR
ncbi:unnamed protein product, partial [Brassica rapa subsp. narinosa]